MRLFFIKFCFLLFATTAQAQNVAGYLGKRFLVWGNVKSFIRIREGVKENSLPINLKYAGSVEYIIYKRFSMSAEYENYSTGFVSQMPYVRSTGYYYDEDVLDKNDVKFTSSVNTIGVSFNFYNKSKGTFAPYGSYKSLSVKYLMLSEKDIDNNLAKQEPNAIITSDPLVKTSGISIGYGVGKKWIFFDRLLFDVKVNFSFLFDTKFRPRVPVFETRDRPGLEPEISSDKDKIVESLEKDMLRRVGAHQFIDLNFGVGLLLF
jgi:hypothetical protein